MDDRHDAEPKFPGELEVALIMSRDTHDRAGAVAHQDIIGDPDWNAFVVGGIDGERAGERACFLFGQIGALEIGFRGDCGAIGFDGFALFFCRDLIDQGIFRGEHHVGGAVERVGPRGEDRNGRVATLRRPVAVGGRPFHGKTNFRALAAADPISLERFDRIRPIQALELVEQPIGQRGDAQHPLAHRTAHHRKPADFAFAIDDFLVRQNGPQLLAPIHRNFGHIRETHVVRIGAAITGDVLGLFRLRVEPGIVDLEENPLRPFVIGGIGRVDLAFPIVGKTDAFELRLEFRDVLARGDGGMLARFDGVLLGGQTERVPAHRMEDIESLQPFVTRDDVGRGVTLGMSDMQAGAARIRKHIEHVILRLRRIEILFAGIRRVK